MKFSQNDKKKKRFYAIMHPMHVQCIKFQTHFKKENVMKKTLLLSLSLSRFCSTLKTTAFT